MIKSIIRIFALYVIICSKPLVKSYKFTLRKSNSTIKDFAETFCLGIFSMLLEIFIFWLEFEFDNKSYSNAKLETFLEFKSWVIQFHSKGGSPGLSRFTDRLRSAVNFTV